MDLKDEKACQLFCGAFSIYKATEFQTAVCWMVTDKESLMTTFLLLKWYKMFQKKILWLAISA